MGSIDFFLHSGDKFRLRVSTFAQVQLEIRLGSLTFVLVHLAFFLCWPLIYYNSLLLINSANSKYRSLIWLAVCAPRGTYKIIDWDFPFTLSHAPSKISFLRESP